MKKTLIVIAVILGVGAVGAGCVACIRGVLYGTARAISAGVNDGAKR
jgi:hypothetical protein